MERRIRWAYQMLMGTITHELINRECVHRLSDRQWAVEMTRMFYLYISEELDACPEGDAEAKRETTIELEQPHPDGHAPARNTRAT